MSVVNQRFIYFCGAGNKTIKRHKSIYAICIEAKLCMTILTET